MSYTPLDQIPVLVDTARKFFNTGATLPLGWRKQQLRQLIKMMNEQRDHITDALYKDLKQTPFLANLAELDGVVKEAQLAIDSLDDWNKPEHKSVPLPVLPAKAYVIRDPLGVALIIAPWNYPFRTLLLPVIGAMAAGNAVVIKPSEVTAHCMALLAKIVPQYLHQQAFPVVCGGPAETTVLLKQRYDHIFYTGNGRVGRIVMRAAVEHLTPVTLELGGKSPVFVDRTADLDIAAKRLVFGKFMNVGQTCVAPDYILVEKSIEKALLAKLKLYIEQFYGKTPEEQQKNKDMSRIVSENHTQRLATLFKAHGKTDFVTGGVVDLKDKFIAPTVITNVSPDAPVMQDEIFGPILPVLPVADAKEFIRFVNARDKPLALYIFSNDKATQAAILKETSSGGVCLNDTIFHISCPDMHFGGVGPSGMGNYNGRATFETFSHRKSVLDKATFPDPSLRYPPYTEKKQKIFNFVNNISVPKGLPSLKQVAAVGAGLGIFALRAKL